MQSRSPLCVGSRRRSGDRIEPLSPGRPTSLRACSSGMSRRRLLRRDGGNAQRDEQQEHSGERRSPAGRCGAKDSGARRRLLKATLYLRALSDVRSPRRRGSVCGPSFHGSRLPFYRDKTPLSLVQRLPAAHQSAYSGVPQTMRPHDQFEQKSSVDIFS